MSDSTRPAFQFRRKKMWAAFQGETLVSDFGSRAGLSHAGQRSRLIAELVQSIDPSPQTWRAEDAGEHRPLELTDLLVGMRRVLEYVQRPLHMEPTILTRRQYDYFRAHLPWIENSPLFRVQDRLPDFRNGR